MGNWLAWLRRKGPPREAGAFGRWAETAAARHLRRHGVRILEHNLRMPAGEIDLVGVERKTDLVCFVEVKARRRRLGAEESGGRPPEWAVDDRKRRRLEQAARQYLQMHRAADLTHRFDILAIETGDGGEEIRWVKGAFGPAVSGVSEAPRSPVCNVRRMANGQ